MKFYFGNQLFIIIIKKMLSAEKGVAAQFESQHKIQIFSILKAVYLS